MNCRLLLAILPIILGVSCASNKSEVDVSVYHLKSVVRVKPLNKVVRAEQQKRLRGAISAEERNSRKGLYYTVDWDLRAHDIIEPIDVVFMYHQAGTASKVITQELVFPETKTKGKCEFAVIGDDYRKNGRVLDWRIELRSGSKLLESEQSYLWK